MPSWVIVFSVTIGYLLVSLAVGLFSGRKASSGTEGYVAGDRNLGFVVLYFILGASIYSAFAFLGGPRVGVLTRCSVFLHHRLRDGRPSSLVLRRPAHRAARAPIRLRHPGAVVRRPLRQPCDFSDSSNHQPRRLRALSHLANAGGRIRVLRGDRRTYSGVGRSGHRLRRRLDLRVQERRDGRRVDEHLSRAS